MKHWKLQAARIDPYTHKVAWRATKDDGTPITRTAAPDTAKHAIRRSQRDGVQGDGYIHTWLVLDKDFEVPDDMRGTRKQQFKPAVRPPEPEVYTEKEDTITLTAQATSKGRH